MLKVFNDALEMPHLVPKFPDGSFDFLTGVCWIIHIFVKGH